ncbi:hypothetical protein JCM12294_47690 [Desulfocicer niacini]
MVLFLLFLVGLIIVVAIGTMIIFTIGYKEVPSILLSLLVFVPFFLFFLFNYLRKKYFLLNEVRVSKKVAIWSSIRGAILWFLVLGFFVGFLVLAIISR